jgi:GrpB-like predicted nucleotidyltransferase (UPF0157 family)
MAEDVPLGLPRGVVRVVAADPRWPESFRAEADRLAAAIARAGLAPLAFEHIGSTAVPRLSAKPILDLMAGYPLSTNWPFYMDVCVAAGYEHRGPQGVAGRELLVLGTEEARTHHLSLVQAGGTLWNEYLAFRDRLRAEPELASAYAALKLDLAARHAGDRGAYTAGKAAFIAQVLRC